MTLGDFISTVLVLATKNRWAELGAYLSVIQEWQKTNTSDIIPDLTEVKVGIEELRDLNVSNQETIMAKLAEMNAAMDAHAAKLDELAAGITKEIEQLKAAGTGGDGMSATEVDGVITRLTTLTGALQTSVDALKADD